MKTNPKTTGRAPKSQPADTVLNVRLLAITALVCVVLAPTLFAWQRYQQQENATAFLKQAATQEKEENWRKAADFLGQYVRMRPTDKVARIRLARAFDRNAKTFRQKSTAVRHYRLAIGSNPDHPDRIELTHRLAELLLELGRFKAAEEQVDALLPENWRQTWEESIPLDSQLARSLRIKALASYGYSRVGSAKATADAVETIKKAVSRNPSDVDLASKLAQIYRERMPNELRELRVRRANEVMNRLVAANWKKDNETAADAYRSRAIYRQRYGLVGSDKDIVVALKIAPENIDVLLTAGWLARQDRQFDASEKYYLAAKKVAPDNVRVYLGLSDVYQRTDRIDDSISVLKEGLSAVGTEHLELNLQLARHSVDTGRIEGIRSKIGSLRSLAASNAQENRLSQAQRTQLYARIDLIDAKSFIAQKNFIAALPLLKRVVVAGQIGKDDTRRDDQRRIAYHHLAECYRAFNQYDLAATAYKRAAQLQPNNAYYPAAAAKTWEDAGHFENAIQDYTLALGLENVPLNVPLGIAWSRFKQQLKRPSESRDWTTVRASIQQAHDAHQRALKKAMSTVGVEAAIDDPIQVRAVFRQVWKDADQENRRELRKIERMIAGVQQIQSLEIDLTVLTAEVSLASGDTKRAMSLLERAFDKNPTSERLAQAVILGNQRQGSPDTADRILKRYEDEVEDSVRPLIMRVTLNLLRGKNDEAKRLLQEAIAEAREPARSLLEYHLAQIHLRLGAAEEARRLIAKLAVASPNDIMLANDAAKLALDAGDLKDVRRWEGQLQNAEGNGGTVWRFYKASRLLREAKNDKDSRIAEAYRLQAEVQSARPSWPTAYFLQGEVFHRLGKVNEAIVAYQTAIDLGERSVSAYQQLIHLLYGQNRFAEADHLLNRLGKTVTASSSLSSMAISRSLERNEIENAIAMAEEGVRKRPDDATAHIWMGQALALAGRLSEAETALQDAVQVEPDTAGAWVALLSFYVRNENTDAARTTLERLRDNVEVAANQQAFILGQGYEVLGDLDEADRYYREGVKVDPDSIQLRTRCVVFFANRDRGFAKESMRHLLKLVPNSRELRHALSLTIASQGHEQDFQDALDILSVDSEHELSAADKRAKALVFVHRGGVDDPQEAIRIMEEVIKDPRNTLPEDHLILASLYESEGRSQRAQEQLLTLVSQNNPPPKHLGEYVRFLLKHGNTSEATAWLEQLVSIDPDRFSTLSLRAQWLAQSDRGDELEPLIEKYLADRRESSKDALEDAQVMINVAGLYAIVDADDLAEQWYAKARKIRPDGYRELANWLYQEGRISESMRVCLESARHDSSPEPAILAAAILARSGAGENDSIVAEPLMSSSLKRFPEDPDLVFSVATLRLIQRRNEEAVGLLRKVLRLDPDHVYAMNNLAMLLAEQPGRQEEALRMIDRAIDLAGPKVELHDTKAVVLMRLNEVDKAIDLLKRITARRTADPRYHFHLALALDQAGLTSEARSALKKAKESGLESMVLTPDERRQLSQFASVTE